MFKMIVIVISIALIKHTTTGTFCFDFVPGFPPPQKKKLKIKLIEPNALVSTEPIEISKINSFEINFF